MDDLVSLIWNQDSGGDHGQVFRPAPPHGQPDALGRLERRVGDRADAKNRDVVEGSDVGDKPQEQLDDDVASDVEVELVLGPARPNVEPPLASGHEQADSEGGQDDGFDDALDDDHLDEGVVLAADRAELLPESREIVRVLDVLLDHRS